MSFEDAGDLAAAACRIIASQKKVGPGERAVAYAQLASVAASAEVAHVLLMIQRGMPVEGDSDIRDLRQMIVKLEDGVTRLRQARLLHDDGP